MCLGIPGRIVEIADAARALGVVDVSGVRRKVDLTCVLEEGRGLESCLGAWVLVHVGFAMSLIDEAEAAETLATLEALGEAMEEVERIRAADAMLGEAP